MPKTATTTVQNWLIANAKALREIGIFTFGGTRFAHRIAVEAVTDPQKRQRKDISQMLAGTPLEWATSDLETALNDPTTKSAIISSEYFSISDPVLVRAYFENCGFTKQCLLVVLRRQDRYLEANYSQTAIHMERVDPLAKQHVYDPGYDWHAWLSRWNNVYGKPSMRTFLFEDLVQTGDFIASLFNCVGQEIQHLGQTNPVSERSNPSLPAALIEFKRLANRLGTFDVLPLLERANRSGVGGPPFRLKRELAKQILDIYRESNRKVAREFFNREGELFDESDIEGEPTGADYTGNLPVEMLAMLFALHLQDHAEHTKQLKDSIEQLAAKIDAALSKGDKPQQG
ncbi:hypothetical protein [Methyloceanibacter sp.]|uniref:hypothetical protein n=1 Tax=Methyloceanibacter sp. TaxID=1965321 RepID=UPI003D6CAED3